MNSKKAIKILASSFPKGSNDFEKLYKLYGSPWGNRNVAIQTFEEKWEKVNFKALKKVIKMYLKERKPSEPKYNFEIVLRTELEAYILKKQID